MTVTAAELDDAIAAVVKAEEVLAARLVTLREVCARLSLPADAPRFVCPVPACGIAKVSERLLDEHLENVHGATRCEGENA